MQTVRAEVEIGRPPTEEQLKEWYAEHNITPNADGSFTELPYGPPPVEKDAIVEQVRVNAQRREVKNLQGSVYNPKIMVFVCGGPTLADHLDELKAKSLDDRYEIYTSNMTCKYLLSKGIKPKYHVIIDPTEKKKKDLDYDADDVTLILGLQCHPAVFEAIGKRKAFKFLAASATNRTPSDVEVAQEACHADDPNLVGIGGGSMMGTRALYLAAVLGYRRIEYYGFDAMVSFENGRVRCYSYDKQRAENILEVEAGNGKTFYSTLAFARQATEIVNLMEKLPGMDVVIHGESFMSNQVAMYKANNAPAPYRVSPEYAKLNNQLHQTDERYGTSGHRHAPRVFMAAAQIARNGKCDVLDYGCGKQTLFKAIESAFGQVVGVRYIGYDPCIPGLNKEPEPAEVVVCTDVMEHVETPCVGAVIDHLHSLTKEILIVDISLRPAKKVLADGRNAHLTLKDADWWASYFQKHFVIIENHVQAEEMLMVLQPIEKYRARKGL